MAAMGLRLAGRSNGVSKLHGEVSREMFAGLWPDVPDEEVPIALGHQRRARRHLGVGRDGRPARRATCCPTGTRPTPRAGQRIVEARPTTSCGGCSEQAASALVAFVRQRLRQRAARRGACRRPRPAWADDAARPRRPHHRLRPPLRHLQAGHLLLSQAERLQALLLDADRPVQFVFAGKAHPADDQGKEMIRQIVAFAAELDVRHRFVFLEDYDIAVARMLVQGADVWLNTPRRPHEACGTSGMKAALNGALNCSILDGWWDEMFDGEIGWAIPSAETRSTTWRRDELEANAPLRPARAPDRPALLRPLRRPGAPRGWAPGEGHPALARPEVVAAAHGPRLRRPSSTSRPRPTAPTG